MNILHDADGFPYIEIYYVGQVARISPLTQKRTLVAEGYVFLGADFEGVVPDIPYSNAQTGAQNLLRGFTQDPFVVQEVRDFLQGFD